MKRTLVTGLCLGAALAVAAVLPQSASAATVDINGHMVDEGVKIVNGTTMLAQDNLRDVMMLNVYVEKNDFTLTNDDKTVTIKGTVGKKTLLVNDQKVTLPVPATFKDEQLWLPLRPLMETFGQVEWDSAAGRVRATFDYTRFNDLLDATVSKQPIPYEIPINSGVGAEDNREPVDVQDSIISEVTKDGYLMSVNQGDKPWITPLHEGYKLFAVRAQRHAYAYDDLAIAWQEEPIGNPTADDRHYLYVQPRKDGAKAVCVDEFPLNINADYQLSDATYQDGKLIWSVLEPQKRQLTVKLYDVTLGQTRILHELMLSDKMEKGLYYSHVTVGGNYAAIAVNLRGNGESSIADVYYYDLKTGDKKPVGRGYNLNVPEIYGDTLVMIASSGTQNTNPVPGGAPDEWTLNPSTLWCYDLKKGEWRYDIDANQMNVPQGNYQLDIPIRLDDNHFALKVYGVGDAYDLTIVNVEKGTLATTKDKNGDVLRAMGDDGPEAAIAKNAFVIKDFSHCQGDNIAHAITFNMVGDQLHEVLYPVHFEW